jgi:hypothetical protein|tara:strand:- start:30796 stop:31377 length:582 start_codon:yes stop_codon:yes gene_type:complete
MNDMKNALVFCENRNLYVRKPNGLEYEFQNVDKPALGFEFDVVIYDDMEVKILKWDRNKNFDEQEVIPLDAGEKELCEQYIANSEAPEGVNLHNQFVEQLGDYCRQQQEEVRMTYGFRDMEMVLIAGREGSNHPMRGNARRVLEYVDNTHQIFAQVTDEIFATKEELLKDYDVYRRQIPQSSMATGHAELGNS